MMPPTHHHKHSSGTIIWFLYVTVSPPPAYQHWRPFSGVLQLSHSAVLLSLFHISDLYCSYSVQCSILHWCVPSTGLTRWHPCEQLHTHAQTRTNMHKHAQARTNTHTVQLSVQFHYIISASDPERSCNIGLIFSWAVIFLVICNIGLIFSWEYNDHFDHC